MIKLNKMKSLTNYLFIAFLIFFLQIVIVKKQKKIKFQSLKIKLLNPFLVKTVMKWIKKYI